MKYMITDHITGIGYETDDLQETLEGLFDLEEEGIADTISDLCYKAERGDYYGDEAEALSVTVEAL